MRTRREIEEKVDKLLRRHEISTAPVDVDAIARNEGLSIAEIALDGEVSGALLRRGRTGGIAVNSAHHLNRRRFTVAHETAHFILDHKGEEDHFDWQFTVIRRDGLSSEASDAQEIEANFFAASLLMPKEMVRKDMEILARQIGDSEVSEIHIRNLARKYLVSEAAMRYRLMNLSLISML